MTPQKKAQLSATGMMDFIRVMPPTDRAEIVGQTLVMAAGIDMDPATVNPLAADLYRAGTKLETIMEAMGADVKASHVTSPDLGAAVGEALRIIAISLNKSRDLGHRRLTKLFSVRDFQERALPFHQPLTLGTVGVSGEIPAVASGIDWATVKLETVGGILQFSRAAVLAADWPLLASITQEMIDAADRSEKESVYGILNANPVLADGVPMFDASRGNIASTPGVPSVATLESAMYRLSELTENNARLGLQPALIVVPTYYALTTAVLLDAGLDRLLSGTATPIVYDPHLAIDAWYLLPDPDRRPVVGLAHLGNARDPIIDRKPQFSSDGIGIRVRHSFGACALSHHAVKVLIN